MRSESWQINLNSNIDKINKVALMIPMNKSIPPGASEKFVKYLVLDGDFCRLTRFPDILPDSLSLLALWQKK